MASSKQPRTFSCELHCGEHTYVVTPVRDAHPDIAERAYRLHKTSGEQEIYHVHCDTYGTILQKEITGFDSRPPISLHSVP